MKRNSIIGAFVLCALCICVVGEGSASAAGLTGLDCIPNELGKGDFEDLHCTNPEPGKGAFTRVPLAANEPIEGVGEGTSILKATVGGNEIKITCTGFTSMGHLTNSETAGVMTATSNDTVITYTGCTVDNPPGCTIPGGTITTQALHSEAIAGTPNTVQFRPAEGTKFFGLTLENCTNSSLNKTYPLTGEITAEASGSMLTTTGTAGGKLKVAGQTAELMTTASVYVTGTTETTSLE